jgi:hypothetical protein
VALGFDTVKKKHLTYSTSERHGELGEPIAKPACTVSVQFDF